MVASAPRACDDDRHGGLPVTTTSITADRIAEQAARDAINAWRGRTAQTAAR